MGAETMKFLLKYLCLILSVVSAIQLLHTSHAVDYTADITAGGDRFLTDVGDEETVKALVKALMDSATNFIWKTFQNTDPAANKDVQVLPLYVQEMDDSSPAAYSNNNEIYFKAAYIQDFSGDLQLEFTGILYHEMTHVWQWNGNGKTPSGLIEGIADYMTLKSDYARSYWPKERGQGKTWDEGYEVTAFFLDYCSEYFKTIMIDDLTAELLEHAFVAELNRMMKDDYNDNYFFVLLGKTVEEMWDDYKSENENTNVGYVGCLSCVIS